MTDLDVRRDFPAGTLDERDERIEARIRLKFQRGDKLTEEEARWFVRAPADKRVPPGVVMEHARREREAHAPPPAEDEPTQ